MKSRFQLGGVNINDEYFNNEGRLEKDEVIEYYKSLGWQIDKDGDVSIIIDRSIDLNVGDILTIKGLEGQEITYKEYNFDKDYIDYTIVET